MTSAFKPRIVDHGAFIEHDMPCPVCLGSGALLNTAEVTVFGRGQLLKDIDAKAFDPCTRCQDKGWQLTQSPKRPWWAFWR